VQADVIAYRTERAGGCSTNNPRVQISEVILLFMVFGGTHHDFPIAFPKLKCYLLEINGGLPCIQSPLNPSKDSLLCGNSLSKNILEVFFYARTFAPKRQRQKSVGPSSLQSFS
jgi:hypothetical protein